MLLRLLADDNPKDQDDDNNEANSCDYLINEVLMMLSSRPRDYKVDDMPEVSKSVINYGINDVFPLDMLRSERSAILEKRILKALTIFEPRMSNLSVSAGNENHGCSSFVIEAEVGSENVRYCLEWDDLLSYFSLRS